MGENLKMLPIKIPEKLHHYLKVTAALRHTTMKEIILEGVAERVVDYLRNYEGPIPAEYINDLEPDLEELKVGLKKGGMS
jgi:hypothetical protein